MATTTSTKGKAKKSWVERLQFWNKEHSPEDMVSQRRRRDYRRLDYRYAEDEPFFFIKGDSVWTGVLLATKTDDFDTIAEENMTVAANTEIYRTLSTYFKSQYGLDQVKTHLLTKYRPADATQWSQQYLDNCWDPSDLFRELVEGPVARHISESTPERRQYLLVHLGKFEGKTTPDAVSRLVGMAESVADEMFLESDLANWRKRAYAVTELMNRYGAEPMTRADLSWIIRKTFSGHFPVDESHSYVATRPWRGQHFDKIADFSARVVGDYLRIQGIDPVTRERADTYTTVLSFMSEATTMNYVYGDSWAKRLRDIKRPVDVSWRMTMISKEKWKKMIDAKIKDAKTEYEERENAGQLNNAAFQEVYGVAMETERTLDRPHPVMVSQLRLVVSAASPEELDDVVSQIRTEMSSFDENIEIDRKTKIQGLLLDETLPGDPTFRTFLDRGVCLFTGGVDMSTRVTDIEALAFARMDSSPLVGDNRHTLNHRWLGWFGTPIGYARDNGAVVHFDPMVQVARNGGAGVLILGATGSGKSSLALMLFFWVSESGVQTIVFDPKIDFENFAMFMAFGKQVNMPGFAEEAADGILGTSRSQFKPVNPAFWNDTDIATLGGGRAGLLDPWEITDTYSEGEDLARNIVNLLVPDKSMHSFLDAAFRRMREHHKSGEARQRPTFSELQLHLKQDMEEATNYLESSETGTEKLEIRRHIAALESVQDILARASQRKFGRLLFANPTDEVKPFRIGKARRTIITLQGLEAPDDVNDVSEIQDDDERDAIALAYVVLKEVSSYALGKQRTKDQVSPNTGKRMKAPLCIFLDELKAFTVFPAARKMLSGLLRRGRSLNITVVPITQQAKDTQGIEMSKGDEGEEVNQFSTVFVFYQKGSSEALAALKMLRPTEGMDDAAKNEMSQQLIAGALDTGQAAMSDTDGRVSIIQVDRMFPEIIAAAETNSKVKADEQNFDPSPHGNDWVPDPTLRDRWRSGIGSKTQRHRATAIEGLLGYEEELQAGMDALEATIRD